MIQDTKDTGASCASNKQSGWATTSGFACKYEQGGTCSHGKGSAPGTDAAATRRKTTTSAELRVIIPRAHTIFWSFSPGAPGSRYTRSRAKRRRCGRRQVWTGLGKGAGPAWPVMLPPAGVAYGRWLRGTKEATAGKCWRSAPTGGRVRLVAAAAFHANSSISQPTSPMVAGSGIRAALGSSCCETAESTSGTGRQHDCEVLRTGQRASHCGRTCPSASRKRAHWHGPAWASQHGPVPAGTTACLVRSLAAPRGQIDALFLTFAPGVCPRVPVSARGTQLRKSCLACPKMPRLTHPPTF